MKKALVFVAVLLIPAMTPAENPDSRPSISFGMNGQTVSISDQPLRMSDIFNVDNLGYWANFKFPSSQNITFQVKFSFQNSDIKWSAEKYRIVDMGFAFTFYIGESVNK